MFKFKVNRSPDTTKDEFLRAIACAKTSIESVLYETSATVELVDDIIEITEANMTLQECKDQLSGCFCDSSGNPYPEFQSVEAYER